MHSIHTAFRVSRSLLPLAQQVSLVGFFFLEFIDICSSFLLSNRTILKKLFSSCFLFSLNKMCNNLKTPFLSLSRSLSLACNLNPCVCVLLFSINCTAAHRTAGSLTRHASGRVGLPPRSKMCVCVFVLSPQIRRRHRFTTPLVCGGLKNHLRGGHTRSHTQVRCCCCGLWLFLLLLRRGAARGARFFIYSRDVCVCLFD